MTLDLNGVVFEEFVFHLKTKTLLKNFPLLEWAHKKVLVYIEISMYMIKIKTCLTGFTKPARPQSSISNPPFT